MILDRNSNSVTQIENELFSFVEYSEPAEPIDAKYSSNEVFAVRKPGDKTLEIHKLSYHSNNFQTQNMLSHGSTYLMWPKSKRK